MDTTRNAEIRAAHEALFPSTPPIPFAVVTLLALVTSVGSLAWSFLPIWAQDIEAAAPLAAVVVFLLMKTARRRWWGVGRLAVWLNLTLVPALVIFGIIRGHAVNTPDGFGVLLLPVLIAAIFCGGLSFFIFRGLAANGPAERPWLRPIPLALITAIVALGCSTFVAEFANEQLDRSQPQFFRPLVTSKGAGTGRVGGGRFYVGLSSFGTWPAFRRWHATSRDYDGLVVGQPACVVSHAGAFGVRWFVVHRCA
jgi:hypothetical protein